MIELVAVAKEVQDFCESRVWPFCIIGGLALQVWGESRLTLDVDMTVLTGFGDEEKYIDPLLERFPSRIPDAKQFALRNRVLLLESPGGIGIDVSLGAFPFESDMISRSGYQEFIDGLNLRICTAEDLIVSKSFAARERDWSDVESILIKQIKLDWDYILRQLKPLVELKYAPEIVKKLTQLRERFHDE